MVVATLLWGGTFTVIRDSVGTLPPLALVCARFSVAGAVFVLMLALRRRWPDRDAWITGLASAPFVAASYALQAIGLTTAAAASSAFLTAAGTLGVAFVAWGALGQRPDRAVLLGTALALAGAALMAWRGPWGFGRGELLTFFGALAYSVHLVIVAARIGRADPIALIAVLSCAVAVLMSPFSWSEMHVFAALDPASTWRFGYLAIAGTVVAPLLQVNAQRVLPPARMGLLFTLEPVAALVIALVIGAERFDLRWWAGAALILSAVVWVESRASAPDAASARPATP